MNDSGNYVYLSLNFFEQMSKENGCKLEDAHYGIKGVGGDSIHVAGTADADIVLGSQVLKQRVLVADTVWDGILGADFLVEHKSQVNMGRLSLKINGEDIPCWLAGKEAMCCRVEVAGEVNIPSGTQAWVPINIQKAGYLRNTGKVEPIPGLVQKNSILMVPGIVNTKETNSVRVLNCSEDTLTLIPGITQIGRAHV